MPASNADEAVCAVFAGTRYRVRGVCFFADDGDGGAGDGGALSVFDEADDAAVKDLGLQLLRRNRDRQKQQADRERQTGVLPRGPTLLMLCSSFESNKRR